MKSPKKIISALLLFACILSGIILAYTPSFVQNKITTGAELDSLIQLSLDEADLLKNQIRVYNIEVDSSLTRKIYRVRVPSTFSKTSFHLNLHERLYPMEFTSPTRVLFPEGDMNIYIEHEGTIFRTIRMITDNSILNEE